MVVLQVLRAAVIPHRLHLQRLPCVALLIAAMTGIALGRFLNVSGWFWAGAAIALLLCALNERLRSSIWPGVVFAFAATQAWQFRESPSARLAQQLPPHRQVCEAVIEVLESPKPLGTGCRFDARLESLSIANQPHPADCKVAVVWHAAPPAYGSRYKVRASIQNIPPPRNPGEANYAALLANDGVRSEIDVFRESDVTLLSTGGNPIVRFAIASRNWIERTLSLGIADTGEAALLLGMTVGDTGAMSEHMKDAFRRTGTYHLFSVSGLHVSIVAVLLWFVLGMTGIDRRRVVIILIPCLFFYALITGLKPASLRAATMLSILAAGLVIDRLPVALNSLGAAGLAILLVDTDQLFNPGFQLSFTVVAAILLIALPVTQRLHPIFDPDPFIPLRLLPPFERGFRALGRWSVALFAVSLSAWVGSLPLTIAYFHLISFVAIPANFLVVPLAFVTLAVGSLSLVTGLFSSWLATVFNNAAFLVCHVILALVTGFDDIPGGSRYVAIPPPARAVGNIVVLDAGRGAASLINTNGSNWIIDSGSEWIVNSSLIPLLRQRGVNDLNGIVLTHGDNLHIGGFQRLAQAFPVENIVDTGSQNRSPTHRRIRDSLGPSGLTTAVAGLNLSLGENAAIEFLYPPPGADFPLADDDAIVLRVSIGDFSAVFLSDSGTQTEEWLLKNSAARLPCDVVIMGRHESGHSGSTRFLAAADPQAVITTAANFPLTEMPRAGWFEALERAGIEVYRQDETGAVTVEVHPDSFTIGPFLQSSSPPRTFPNDPVR